MIRCPFKKQVLLNYDKFFMFIKKNTRKVFKDHKKKMSYGIKISPEAMNLLKIRQMKESIDK